MDPATISGGATAEHATTILGKYTVGPLLGRGAFAKVYHCRSTTTNASVAIKVTDKSNASKALAPYILREVAAMRRLDHPNILRIHELLATKSKIYLVIELARGGDLHTRLHRLPGHRLPLKIALRVFHQLVSALHFCHQHGVTHRDLKPHNILLDQDGNVKLSDFGLSAIAGVGLAPTELLLQSQCGTLVFMAPEVMAPRPRRYDGAKADSWSCGVILYQMVVGALPFNHTDEMGMMYLRMIRRQFSFPPNLNDTVKNLIFRLLDPNPVTRLSVVDVARDIRANGVEPLGDLVVMNEGSGSSANAFDLIGARYWMVLSGMFDDVAERKRRVFAVNESVEAVVEKVVVVGGRLGYEVKGGRGWKIWLKRGRLVLMVEVLEVVLESSMVDIEVVEGCRCDPCRGDGGGDGGDEIGGGSGSGGMQEALFKFLFYGHSYIR